MSQYNLTLPAHRIISNLLGCKGSLGHARDVLGVPGRVLLMLPAPAETIVMVEAGACCSTKLLCAWLPCLGISGGGSVLILPVAKPSIC